jgi:hypothetical protein
VFDGLVTPPDPTIQITVIMPFATLVNGVSAAAPLTLVRQDSLRLNLGSLEMPTVQATRQGDNALALTNVPAFALLTTSDLHWLAASEKLRIEYAGNQWAVPGRVVRDLRALYAAMLCGAEVSPVN